MQDTSEADATPLPSSPSHLRWIALGGVWLVYAAFGATAASLAPLIPEIRADLDTSNAMLGAVLGAWPLVYIAAAIPAGALLDAIGPRLGLFFATIVIALSAALRAWADTPLELMVAVGVFGLGGPLISVGAPKLITGLFEGSARGMAIGIYITGPNVGAIFSLMATTPLLLPMAGDWQGVMLIHSGIALAAGAVWLVVSAVARVSASGPGREPFQPSALKAIFSNPQVLLVLGMAVGAFYLNHAFNNWLPAILRFGGMDPKDAGFWAAVPTLVGLVVALIVPRLATGGRRLPILMSLYAVAGVTAATIALADGSALYAALYLQGLVRGALMSVTILVLVELPTIPKERIGLASGAFFAAGEIGGVLGPLTYGVLRDATGDFNASLASSTVMAALMIALALLLKRSLARG